MPDIDQNVLESYSASESYKKISSPLNYEERAYYSGIIGALRKFREEKILEDVISGRDIGGSVLDCPCGNGRWFRQLSKYFNSIVGVDISPQMLKVAQHRGEIAKLMGKQIVLKKGRAEALPLEDDAVDYVFSYALMKHLPLAAKQKVLSEFVRVARKGIFCSFAVFTAPSFLRWKSLDIEESYPLWEGDLEELTAENRLGVKESVRLFPVVGLQTLTFLSE